MADRILIIDDEPDVADSLKLGLTRAGFSVMSFTDSMDAVSKFRANTFDLVLLDIRMPRMNGFEVFRELRKIDPKVKICFLTAFEVYKSEFDRMFPDLDAQYFLKKPVSIAELKKAIDKMLV